jgi:uncharacterized membrane protein YebE (DUF533 family)
MIGKILGAAVGERVARRYGTGARGAIVGALVPVVARRMFGPLGLLVAGGYVAKKYYDRRKTTQPAQG